MNNEITKAELENYELVEISLEPHDDFKMTADQIREMHRKEKLAVDYFNSGWVYDWMIPVLRLTPTKEELQLIAIQGSYPTKMTFRELVLSIMTPEERAQRIEEERFGEISSLFDLKYKPFWDKIVKEYKEVHEFDKLSKIEKDIWNENEWEFIMDTNEEYLTEVAADIVKELNLSADDIKHISDNYGLDNLK